MSEYGKVGLVLSGGGAKGAYQVGVLKALVEFDIPVHVISGASIGALNGAVLAAASNLQVGTERLKEIWLELSEISPLKHQTPSYLSLLCALGLRENIVIATAHSLLATAQSMGLKLPEKAHRYVHPSIMDDHPLKVLLDKYINYDDLSTGIPFYISVFRSLGGILDSARVLAAELRLLENRNSEFIHIQAMPNNARRELLLASAAIPMVFAPRQVNGAMYSDGGQGGWSKAQGNTPITPLIDADCDIVLVTHLNDGSLWSRHDFPDTSIIEIRPQSIIAREGMIKDLLGFDGGKIKSWIEQGYSDTQHCIGQILQAGKARQKLAESVHARLDSEKNNLHADKLLSTAMARLR